MFNMDGDHKFFLWYLVLLFAVHTSKSHCTNGTCEKVSLSLATNMKQNFTLVGYVFEKLSSILSWKQCFNICLQNCQCLSFNFNEVNTTDNCELNDANTKLAPKSLEEREGDNYYELGRGYFDKNGVAHKTCSEPACHSHCCDSTPCHNGGTCSEICDVNQRRFSCACPPNFMGHRCQFPVRSCKDIMMINKENINGIYNLLDQNNKLFPVFCDFTSESGAAWTLIQSHSLENNDVFKNKAFYLHDMPINQDAPEWNSYRLSMSRMQSIQDDSTHWRATCNFDTSVMDYRDYIRVSLKRLDLLVQPNTSTFCLLTEFVNVRGDQCENCTVLIGYGSGFTLHMDSHFGPDEGCDFGGGIYNEDNFGYYNVQNLEFGCTSSNTSTTQFWLGSV